MNVNIDVFVFVITYSKIQLRKPQREPRESRPLQNKLVRQCRLLEKLSWGFGGIPLLCDSS